MKPLLLSPMLYGKLCVVKMPNGKQYRRVVRYSRADGLYIVIATRKYFEYEMEYNLERWVFNNEKEVDLRRDG